MHSVRLRSGVISKREYLVIQCGFAGLKRDLLRGVGMLHFVREEVRW